MKIFVKVKPQARVEKVEKVNENGFVLQVKAPPKEGRANQEAVELLSEYFHVAKSRIKIIKGHKSRNKIMEIL